MSQRKRLALIDGHALAFRAFFALKDSGMRSSRGEPTYAVFGFAQILLTMIQEQRPEYVAISFDVGRTFRDDLYAEYKAGRAETPEEFHPQLARIQELCRALNMPIYVADGFEADDVIGTLARQATALGIETLILTGDTDSLQLVDDHVRVILANPYGQKTTTTIYDEEKVRERYKGLAPGQLADLRGLKGDSSDNIPGVKGIGEAGAIALLNQFGTVEQLYDRLAEAPKRYQKPLEGQREAAVFSKRLATIVCDAPVRLSLADATVHDYDRAAVIRLFQELELGASSGLLKKLPGDGMGAVAEVEAPRRGVSPPVIQQDMFGQALPEALGPPAAPSAAGPAQLSLFGDAPPPAAPAAPSRPALGDYRAVTTEDELAALVRALAAAPGFAFDTEASGLRPFQSELCGISLAVAPGSAVYVPCGHAEGPQLPAERVLAALRPFFEDAAKPKYAHNAKFDIEMLLSAGVVVRGLAFDTMVAAALLGKRAGLKDLAFYELGLPDAMTPIEDLIGRGSKQVTFDKVPIATATPYAAADADMTLRLVQALEPQLAQHERLDALFRRLELPLVDVLVKMEQAGIAIDKPYIEQLGVRLGARIATIEQEIHQIAGGPFNINSGDQLSDVLFGKIGLPTDGVERTAKTKKYSITADTLEKLRDKDSSGICERILEYRQLSKLKSTYVDGLPGMVNPKTGRVHTSYNQVGAATGRLSSAEPSLQNIPVRTQEGREIRRGFVAAPGHTFVAADYSQIELRVLAYITRDPSLVRAFQEGQDIHAATAAQLFGVDIDKVDKNQRRIAKCVAAGTLVLTEHGIVPIEQVGDAEVDAVTDLHLAVAQESKAQAQATGFYNGGVKPTVRITTKRGYQLEATTNHRVRVLNAFGDYSWRWMDELKTGDYVALARGALLFGQDQPLNITYRRRNDKILRLPERLSPDLARFLGYFVAEGSLIRGKTSISLVIANKDPEVLDDLRSVSQRLLDYTPGEVIDRNGVTSMRWSCSRLAELVEQLGIGDGAANKRIPDVVMRSSYESVSEFLRAYFEGDGSISKSFISAGSKSETLMRQLQSLLLNFGIVAYLEHRDIPNYGRHYKLRLIGRESRALFAEHIGFISTRKSQRLVELLTKRVTHEAVVLPGQVVRLERMYPKTKRELKELIHTCIRTKSPTIQLTYRRLGTILEQFPEPDDDDAQELREHLGRNLFYDRVATIEHGESQVYDLVVPETNTYIANGFVSHNTVVFGVIYGISAFGLAQRTELSRSEAQALIDGLFARFPGIREYISRTLEQGQATGYVNTLFGRRRNMPDLQTKGPRRAAAEREAINAPIQGTAADIMKIAMVHMARALAERGLRTRLLLQVHDELILEAPDDELEAVKELVCAVMEQAYELKWTDEAGVEQQVPLGVDVESGPNWEEMG